VTVPVSDVPPAEKGAVRLRIQLERQSDVAVELNGRPIDLKRFGDLEECFGMVWLTGPVPQEVLKSGGNQVSVQLPDSAAANQLAGVEVLVEYSGTE
ncbi:MAG: hypothetical protein ABIK89_25865, partial [Planctomycetota bacterium]